MKFHYEKLFVVYHKSDDSFSGLKTFNLALVLLYVNGVKYVDLFTVLTVRTEMFSFSFN